MRKIIAGSIAGLLMSAGLTATAGAWSLPNWSAIAAARCAEARAHQHGYGRAAAIQAAVYLQNHNC